MNAVEEKVIHEQDDHETSPGEQLNAVAEDRPARSTTDYEPARAGIVTHFVCGAVTALLGLGSLLVAWDLGFGSLTQPQAGAWPGILSILLLLLGVFIMLRAKTFDDAEKLTRNAVAVGVGALSLVAAVQLMPLVGFEIPAVLLTVFWMSVLGKEKYVLSVPLSIVAVAVFYFIFVLGLGVPIPRLF